jgi:hypothetical protein
MSVDDSPFGKIRSAVELITPYYRFVVDHLDLPEVFGATAGNVWNQVVSGAGWDKDSFYQTLSNYHTLLRDDFREFKQEVKERLWHAMEEVDQIGALGEGYYTRSCRRRVADFTEGDPSSFFHIIDPPLSEYGDAYRHIFVTCVLTMRYGRDIAKAAMDAHEGFAILQTNPEAVQQYLFNLNEKAFPQISPLNETERNAILAATIMDLHNNALGFALGEEMQGMEENEALYDHIASRIDALVRKSEALIVNPWNPQNAESVQAILQSCEINGTVIAPFGRIDAQKARRGSYILADLDLADADSSQRVTACLTPENIQKYNAHNLNGNTKH